MVITKTHKDIKAALMEPRAKGIKEPFYLIRDEDQVIFIITSGKNGSEFNKYPGFFINYSGVNIYTCLHGQGVVIMQRNDENGEAKEFKVVTLSSSRQVEVPAGWGVCFINIGRSFLVVYGPWIDADYLNDKPIIEKKGLAYWVVEKKGEINFEQNPNYRVHPQITTE